jgi:molybdenum cofactor cytidylyltransferase
MIKNNKNSPSSATCVEGIILAAGLSTRMKTDKLAISVNGRTVLDRVLDAATSSTLAEIHLVTSSRLAKSIESPRAHIIINPTPEAGMSSSLRLGIASLSDTISGAMILLGDQPLITSIVIDMLLTKFDENPNNIILPLKNGRRTTPVIFPEEFFPELAEVTGDQGGRTVLKNHQDRILGVEMSSYYNDLDIDRPEDLSRLEAILAGAIE